jgi:hypothetical protein
MNRTSLVLVLFVAAIVSGFLMNYNREGFAQKEVGMPLDGPPMGPYDKQGSGPLGGWSGNEMPVGSLPQNQAMEQNKFMFLANNQSSVACCADSSFSGDVGCVCLSESDKSMLNTRGGNR